MRIDNTRRPAASVGVCSYQKAGNTSKNAPAARASGAASDAASVLGIPQDELTPKVQEAIVKLM